MTCPICMEIMVEPHSGTCGHSVCALCVQKLARKVATKECPQCRAYVRFSLNFALRDMVRDTNPEAYRERLQELDCERDPKVFVSVHQKEKPTLNLLFSSFPNVKTVALLKELLQIKNPFKRWCRRTPERKGTFRFCATTSEFLWNSHDKIFVAALHDAVFVHGSI